MHATRHLLLATAFATILPGGASACGSPPGARATPPRLAAAARCPLDALAGEWIGEDGGRIRIVDAGDRGFTWMAVRLQGDGSVDELVYSQLRLVGDCTYLGRRHVDLDEGLHPAPPHHVTLSLDPDAGVLADDYHYTAPLRWRRATGK